LVGLLEQVSPEMLVIALVDVLAISSADMLEHWWVSRKPRLEEWPQLYPLCKARCVISGECLLILSCLLPFSAASENHSAFFHQRPLGQGLQKSKTRRGDRSRLVAAPSFTPHESLAIPWTGFDTTPAAVALQAGLPFSQGLLTWRW
jgi:hypothetical protein